MKDTTKNTSNHIIIRTQVKPHSLQHSISLLFLLILMLAASFLLIFTATSNSYAQSIEKIDKSGWFYPTGTSILGNYRKFLHTSSDGCHLAIDIAANWGDPVYAIGDGYVVEARSNVTGYKKIDDIKSPGGAMLVRHTTDNGNQFIANYGHVQNFVASGSHVTAGQKIAEVGQWDGAHHLHFAIRPGSGIDSNSYRGYSSTCETLYGYVDPLPYLRNNPSASPTVTLNSPADKSAINTSSVSLGWSNPDAYPGHRWIISTNKGYLESIKSSSTWDCSGQSASTCATNTVSTSTSGNVSASVSNATLLTPGGTYYWMVRSAKANQPTRISEIRGFYRQIVLSSPSSGASSVPVPVNFTWQSSGMTAHRIQVSTSNSGWTAANGFTSSSATSSTVPVNAGATSSYSWSGASPGTTYWWTVRAANTEMGITTDYTQPRSFTTAASASTYTLTVNSSGASGVAISGSSSTYSGTTNYTRSSIPSGTSIILTAPATSGSANFSSWTGCNLTNTTNRTCTVSMTSTKTVTANYTAPKHYIVTFDLAGGYRTGGGALYQTVVHGQSAVAPTFTPPVGKTFSRWSRDFGNVTADMSIVATYGNTTYVVISSSGTNGSINLDGEQLVFAGQTTSFVVSPSPGYIPMMGGTCGGEMTGDIYTTHPVSSDCNVHVLFHSVTSIPVTSDMTLDWAERAFPQLFPRDIAVRFPGIEFEGVIYNAREYAGAWGIRYLGITPDGRIFGLGDFTDYMLQQFETIYHWADQVLADLYGGDAGAPPPVAPGPNLFIDHLAIGVPFYNVFFEGGEWKIITVELTSNTALNATFEGNTYTGSWVIIDDDIVNIAVTGQDPGYFKLIGVEEKRLNVCYADSLGEMDVCDEYFYFKLADAQAHGQSPGNDHFVSYDTKKTNAKIIFKNHDGQIIPIPSDAMVRVVPNAYSDIGMWNVSLHCIIKESGTFTEDCFTWKENINALSLSFSNPSETFQFVIYRNSESVPSPWKCGGDTYRYIGDRVDSNWNIFDVDVFPSDYQSRAGEDCHD